MFGTIRKHQTWLWIVIIGLTIVSFVYFFTPSGKYGGGQGGENIGVIGGHPVSREDYRDALSEVDLRFFMAYGQFPTTEMKQMGFNPERETYQRLFFIQKINELNIHVDPSAVAKAANNILRGIGGGNPVSLDAFVTQVLAPHGLNAADFERYIRHDLAIQQLFAVIEVSGKMVTPAEAQTLYTREHRDYDAQMAAFSASNYVAAVAEPTPEALAHFYTNHMSEYRIPDRVQVAYVKFPATNFLTEADKQIAGMTNINAAIERVYQQRGTNYYKENLTPEETKAKIRDEIRHEFALSAAHKAANEFARNLDALKTQRPENLAELAKTNGLTVKVSEPFSEYPPDEIGPVKDFVSTAMNLTEGAPFAGPLVGSDAVYDIALDKKIEGHVPPLAEIHSQVLADYKMNTAVMMARRAGSQFALTLTNGLAEGKTFAGMCVNAKVQPIAIPPFSLSTTNLSEQVESHIGLYQLKQIVFDLPPGKASQFVPTMQGGVVVYLRDRLPIDQARMRAEMPAFMENLRRTRQNEAINFWFRREVENDPGFRQILDQLAREQNAARS